MTSTYKPWTVNVRAHPGSSPADIANEPNWGSGHQHRIGYRNRSGRVPGLTHERDDYSGEIEQARESFTELRKEARQGKLVNFRDLIQHQEDFHLRHPENRSLGWRYVLEATEDWVKNKEEWPANIKRKQQQKEKEEKEEQQQQDQKKKQGEEDQRDGKSEKAPQQEHEWKRSSDKDKHHDAYVAGDQQEGEEDKSLADKYTPQEIALLRALEHEKNYITTLKENDGTGKSPQTRNRTQISIDEQDQFGPDNWLPRSSDLIRLTGKHPMNAEADLSHLFEAGLITPNELHYVRNHGAVPRLLWEYHSIDVEYAGTVKTLSMDELQSYSTINIPVALACDGNRRKELNMVRKSKGFNWGAGGVSCAYWKGPLLRDVLLSAGVPQTLPGPGGKRYWVNFEGADELSDAKYSTSIPFEYAMDVQNDVMLAYEMNDVPLPPDHGYPVRVMIPGYVGGRCVKWVKKIWVSEKENDSHYHIWDNRVLPAFVTEKDGPFAEALFRHPDTACNEQNLNSIVVKPAHGEKVPLSKVRRGRSYRIEGLAYDGGGHEVQRVEVSLDDGKTWLYCIRRFPDKPIRHGNKFWAWIHWHVDVEVTHLVRAGSLTVRCFNVFKNTQPRDTNWNIMGMMNNCWYVVRPEIVDNADNSDDNDDEDPGSPAVLFRHPVEPGTGDGGWMKQSVENRMAEAKQKAGAPQKQFTREEIEKHDRQDDCWIVVDGKVYDATSVLEWHPGGAAAIMGHAGKVHRETTDEFASIHDDFAYQKLQECVLGSVTEKAATFIKQAAEASAREKSSSTRDADQLTLQRHRWVPVKLMKREKVSEDTRTYTFLIPEDKELLGLGTCQHVQIGFHLKDRMLIRSYTPTRPLLPRPPKPKASGRAEGKRSANGQPGGGQQGSVEDGDGTFDLTVKTYFPSDEQPGGAMSNILDCMPLGEEVEIRGPTGDIVYNGQGDFVIEGRERHYERVSLVLGGSGITPGYSLLARIMLDGGDKTAVRVVDANKTEADILLKDELDGFEKRGGGQLQVTHVLSHAGEEWRGEKGHVNEEIIKRSLFEPADDAVALLCGPPAMIQKAALPALKDWGYVEDDNMFGF